MLQDFLLIYKRKYKWLTSYAGVNSRYNVQSENLHKLKAGFLWVIMATLLLLEYLIWLFSAKSFRARIFFHVGCQFQLLLSESFWTMLWANYTFTWKSVWHFDIKKVHSNVNTGCQQQDKDKLTNYYKLMPTSFQGIFSWPCSTGIHSWLQDLKRIQTLLPLGNEKKLIHSTQQMLKCNIHARSTF